MIKTILPETYDHNGDSLVSLVPVTKRGIVDTRTKSASKNIAILQGMSLNPKPQHSIIHLIAMGTYPSYPANTNADIFCDVPREIKTPEGKGVIRISTGMDTRCKTFETDAKVYKEHFNRPQYGDQVYGEVLKALLHPTMRRVELLIEVPDRHWTREINSLANGEDSTAFSMSCNINHDHCTICGQKTPVAAKYCDHVKTHLGKLWHTGDRVAVVNENETFFDISGVKTKADHVAFGLCKAASGAKLQQMSALQLAEYLGMSDAHAPLSAKQRYASTRAKLAAMEKTISLTAPANSPINQSLIANLGDTEHQIIKISCANPTDVLSDLADVKIVVSLKDFLRIVLRDQFPAVDELVPEVEQCIPGVFGRMDGGNQVVPDEYFNLDDLHSHVFGGAKADELRDNYGMETAPARASIMILRGEKQASKRIEVQEPRAELEQIAQTYAQYKLACCLRHPYDIPFHKDVVAAGYY